MNQGFVCYMNREDAEEAMEACNEKDPFNVGRQLMMRWGKNVKKNVRFGSGRMIVPPSREKIPQNELSMDATNPPAAFDGSDEAAASSLPHVIQLWGQMDSRDISKADTYQADMHLAEAIRVELPSDTNRFHFISTVASYVARDGSSLERALIQSEAGNPIFNFLTLSNAIEHQRKEYIFYRWRVYSFCQGDRYSEWRTEPFVMFHPKGRFWIPPPLKKDLVERRIQPSREKSKTTTCRQEDPTSNPEKQDFLTGRQFERAMGQLRKGNRRGIKADGRDSLTTNDLEHFGLLVRKKLSISRESICRAMAFCFEKSASAKEIVPLLKEALLDEKPSTTVDHRIARLYLISDILFNSQQPGVKNAFMYRDALEKMAPEIFTALGKHGGNNVGRMTMNKLRNAVSSVLGAWTEWSVYNPAFLDELEARFDGREVKETPAVEANDVVEEPKTIEDQDIKEAPEIIINQPQGGWTEVDDESDIASNAEQNNDYVENPSYQGTETSVMSSKETSNVETKDAAVITRDAVSSTKDYGYGATGERPVPHKESTVDYASRHAGQYETTAPLDGGRMQNPSTSHFEDLDGSPLADEIGAAINEDIDGAPVEEGVDGAPVEDEDIDGAPVDEGVDGAPVEDNEIDGAQLDSEDIDGVPIQENFDGDPYDDVDGSPLDDTDVSGKPQFPPTDGGELSQGEKGGADEDLDGETLGAAELDGEVMGGESLDVEGEPCGDDIDGEEIDGEDM
jgi:U2-associated protein SR140